MAVVGDVTDVVAGGDTNVGENGSTFVLVVVTVG